MMMTPSERQHDAIKSSRMKMFKTTITKNSPLNAPPNTVRRIKSRERAMATPAPSSNFIQVQYLENVCIVIAIH